MLRMHMQLSILQGIDTAQVKKTVCMPYRLTSVRSLAP